MAMRDTLTKAAFDAMGRCTTEEIWATGAMVGVSGVVVAQASKIGPLFRHGAHATGALLV